MLRGRLRGVQAPVLGPIRNKQQNWTQEPGGCEFRPVPSHATIPASTGLEADWSKEHPRQLGTVEPKVHRGGSITSALSAPALPICPACLLISFDPMFLRKTQAIITENGFRRLPWGPFPLSTKSQEGLWEEHLHPWQTPYILSRIMYTWRDWRQEAEVWSVGIPLPAVNERPAQVGL